MNSRTDSFSHPFFLSPDIYSFWRFQLPSLPLGLKGTSESCKKEVLDWVNSSNLLSLNDPEIPVLLHTSFSSRFSLDVSFASSSLTLSCTFELLYNLDCNHLLVLLTASLSSLFRLNKRVPFYIFQKARWYDFAFYFDSHCPFAKK